MEQMKKNTILVVDDAAVNREMLCKIFAPGYTVRTAADGQEAMQVMNGEAVDLVLLDLQMPGMDGFAVIEAMRADRRLAPIPIVVETVAAGAAERRALELGADDFIVKPYDPFVVRRRVENLIQKYVLQIDNLRQALDQSEQLNTAKNTFLSRMSHELRSPVNSVITLASLQRDAAEDAEQVREYSDKIIESSRYLLGVINDVLNMSAIENNKITIIRTPFDFRRQIETIATLFYGQCKQKNIRFTMSLTDFTEEFLFGDPVHLKEILVNLLSNAVKFTPQGGHISVRVEQLARKGSEVKLRFSVADDGEGIEEARQQSIFEPFTQENNAVRSRHGGSGLGLSIVKSMAKLMDGEISLQSKKGEGSTFIVDLPFTVAKEMPRVDNEKLHHVRAIIIDDDEDTQRYGKKMMDKMGIACDAAYTGEEALQKMRDAFDHSRGYDICFVDWKMPGMSGVDITKAIRDAFDDDTIIVVASAYDLAEIEEDAKFAGANLVVPKPMFQSTVFDLLMDITGGQYADATKKPDYDFTGKRVLVAEDNTLNAEMAMDLLRIAGFEAERAADGNEVCDMFNASAPGYYDAILMDIQMPYRTGHEATRAIRAGAHPQGKTIPILAVTANAFTEDIKASLQAGMNGYVAKPIDTARLYRLLDELVGQTK